MKFLAVLFILFSFISSYASPAGAELIIINANVRTMASAQSKAEAVAVSGGEIVAVGSTKTIRSLADENTKVIDADDRLVMPGFNDAHVHFAAIGNIFSSVKLVETRTPEEFVQRINDTVRFLPKGRWILGSGWDNRSWIPNDPPSRDLIDAFTADNPVFVYNTDATAVLVNSKALEVAGIDKATKDPAGGRIFRDSSGEATGLLRGSAIQIVERLVPKDHMRNWPQVIEAASNYAASLGVTSVQDTHSDDLFILLLALDAQRKLKTRVYDCSNLADWRKFAAKGVQAGSGNPMVRNGCMKSFADDEMESTAELERDVIGADKAKLQVAIHAIGEKPNETALSIFEKAAKINGPRDRRFRVEHARNASDPDRGRFTRLNIIASMQPWLFFGENGTGSDDFKKIFEHKTLVAFGSDASMTDFDPIKGIYAAVTGKNAISVEQAVRAYTIGSAFAEFQENIKGTIEVGKLADIVILSDDIFSIDRSKIRNVRVETTIVGGKVVYQKDEKLKL